MAEDNNYTMKVEGHTFTFGPEFGKLSPDAQREKVDLMLDEYPDADDDDWLNSQSNRYHAKAVTDWIGNNKSGSAIGVQGFLKFNDRVQANMAGYTDEEAVAHMFDLIGQLNGNLSRLGQISGELALRDDMPPEVKRSFARLMYRYQNKKMSRAGFGNTLEGIVRDPITLATLGLGKVVVTGGKAAAGGGIKQVLKNIIKGGAVGAAEGVGYGVADNAARQTIDIGGERRDEYSTDELLEAGVVGGAVGGVLGGAAGGIFGDIAGMQKKYDASRAAQDSTPENAKKVLDLVKREVEPDTPLQKATEGSQKPVETPVGVLAPTPAKEADVAPKSPKEIVEAMRLENPDMIGPPRFDPEVPYTPKQIAESAKGAKSAIDELVKFSRTTLDKPLSHPQTRTIARKVAPRLMRLYEQSPKDFADQVADMPTTTLAPVQAALTTIAESFDELIMPVVRERTALLRRNATEEMDVLEEMDKYINTTTVTRDAFVELDNAIGSAVGRALQARRKTVSESPEAYKAYVLNTAVEAGKDIATARQLAEDLYKKALKNKKYIPTGIEEIDEIHSVAFQKRLYNAITENKRNFLLSNIRTFLDNSFGAVRQLAIRPALQYIGSFGDAADGAIIRRQVHATYAAYAVNAQESFKFARKAWTDHRLYTGIHFIDGSEGLEKPKSISAKNLGAGKFVKDKTGAYKLDAEGKPEFKANTAGKALDAYGAVVRTSDRIQLFSDTFLSTPIARGAVAADIVAKNPHLTMDQLKPKLQKAFDELFDENGYAQSKIGRETADELMGRNRPTAIGKDAKGKAIYGSHTDSWLAPFEKFLNNNVIGQGMKYMFFFFTRTPTRLIQQGVRMTPGMQNFSKSFRRDFEGLNGPLAASRARAEFGVAWGLVSQVGLGVMAGNFTGSMGGIDPQRYDQTRNLMGSKTAQPYSVKIAGRWYNYGRAEPFGTAMRMVADAVESGMTIAHNASEDEYENNMLLVQDAFTSMLSVVSAATLENTMFQGLEDIMDIITTASGGEKNMGDKVGEIVAQEVKASTVPNIVQKLAQFQDDTMYQSSGWNKINQHVYLHSPYVAPRRNPFGEIMTHSPMQGMFGLPLDDDATEVDAVWAELAMIQVKTKADYSLPKTKSGVKLMNTLTDPKDGEEQTTIHDAWGANIEKSGLKERLRDLYNSDRYKERSYGGPKYTGWRREETNKIINKYRRRAWKDTLRDNPEFKAKLKAEEQKQRAKARQ